MISRGKPTNAKDRGMSSLDSSSERNRAARNEVQILIVEDDEPLRKLLLITLKLDGYQVLAACDGREALVIFKQNQIDCVLLDINMPFIDGLQVCAELRKSHDVPIIIITANSRTDDVITAMELGADHYMTKPFELQELRARIRAILRRVNRQTQRGPTQIITYGDIAVNETAQRVSVCGEVITLTPNEYGMLTYLMHHPDQPVSKEEILRTVWAYYSHEDLAFVRVTMRRLRSKVEKDPSNPQYLKTIHGFGYQFSTKSSADATGAAKDSLLTGCKSNV